MKKLQVYYENTKNLEPYPNVKNYIENHNIKGKAIDLGCGAGRDTIFLLKNGWTVIAIDKRNVAPYIEKQISNQEKKKFKFICQDFETVKLEKADLIVANSSLSFCNKNYFKEFWKEIISNIQLNRIFYWKFFWKKRFMGFIRKRNDFF